MLFSDLHEYSHAWESSYTGTYTHTSTHMRMHFKKNEEEKQNNLSVPVKQENPDASFTTNHSVNP